MKGRKKKPLSIRAAEGDLRKVGAKKLALQIAAEPKASRGLPVCPAHLQGRAAEVWIFWADELAKMDLDRRPDAMMLEGACVAYDHAVQADELLATDGVVVREPIVDKDGNVVGYKRKKHPAVEVSKASWAQVRAFASEFGLSPASRARITTGKPQQSGDDRDLMALLSKPRAPRPTVN